MTVSAAFAWPIGAGVPLSSGQACVVGRRILRSARGEAWHEYALRTEAGAECGLAHAAQGWFLLEPLRDRPADESGAGVPLDGSTPRAVGELRAAVQAAEGEGPVGWRVMAERRFHCYRTERYALFLSLPSEGQGWIRGWPLQPHVLAAWPAPVRAAEPPGSLRTRPRTMLLPRLFPGHPWLRLLLAWVALLAALNLLVWAPGFWLLVSLVPVGLLAPMPGRHETEARTGRLDTPFDALRAPWQGPTMPWGSPAQQRAAPWPASARPSHPPGISGTVRLVQVVVATTGIGLAAEVFSRRDSPAGFLLLVLALVLFCIVANWGRGLLTRRVKEGRIATLAADQEPPLRFQPQVVHTGEFASLPFWGRATRFDFEDQLAGEYQGVPFTVQEGHTSYRPLGYNTVLNLTTFRGCLVRLPAQPAQGPVIVLPDHLADRLGARRSKAQVQPEDPHFAQRFRVYAEDPADVRRLLPPAVQRALARAEGPWTEARLCWDTHGFYAAFPQKEGRFDVSFLAVRVPADAQWRRELAEMRQFAHAVIELLALQREERQEAPGP